MAIWRLIDDEYNDPVLNLAVEEAIMEKVREGDAPNTLRFWRNISPTVVVGKFQIVGLEINKEACKKHGVRIVRRFTGGGTVYQDDGNLNYAVSVRRNAPVVPSAIADIIPTLCKGVVEGLRMLGLNAKFESEGAYIHIKGKKVSGTAAALRREVAFVHGTLLVNSNLTRLREVLDAPPYPAEAKHDRLVRSIRKEVTSLQDELGRKVTLLEAKTVLRKGFAKALNIEFQPGALLRSELELAEEIAAEKLSEILLTP